MSIDLGKAAFGWVVVVWLTAPALLGFFIAYKVINIEKDIKTYVNDLPEIVAQGIVLDRTNHLSESHSGQPRQSGMAHGDSAGMAGRTALSVWKHGEGQSGLLGRCR